MFIGQTPRLLINCIQNPCVNIVMVMNRLGFCLSAVLCRMMLLGLASVLCCFLLFGQSAGKWKFRLQPTDVTLNRTTVCPHISTSRLIHVILHCVKNKVLCFYATFRTSCHITCPSIYQSMIPSGRLSVILFESQCASWTHSKFLFPFFRCV